MIDIKYQECIQSVIDYIENNLQSNLSNAELAGIAGYSEYHFLRIFKDIVHLNGGVTVEDYGVSFWNPKTHRLDYYIGIREEDARGDLTKAITLKIEGGLYAIFKTPPASHFDFVNTIHKTWDNIARVWLPGNGYVRTGGYELESYVEESREFSEIIYIPIKKENAYNEKIRH